jgi:hypothetical protein
MKTATLSIPVAALLLCSGETARAQEPGQPAQGKPGVTRPAEDKAPRDGPQGVSPAGGAGGGRSAAPT